MMSILLRHGMLVEDLRRKLAKKMTLDDVNIIKTWNVGQRLAEEACQKDEFR